MQTVGSCLQIMPYCFRQVHTKGLRLDIVADTDMKSLSRCLLSDNGPHPFMRETEEHTFWNPNHKCICPLTTASPLGMRAFSQWPSRLWHLHHQPVKVLTF
jgi:hypothetical protein